jgi:ornithine carbamoyltransferase
MPRHFLAVDDFSADELCACLTDALRFRADRSSWPDVFGGRSVACVFHKPSLRTRVSFEVGITNLGGSPLYVTDAEIKLGVRESIADVARVLSRYVAMMMIRTSGHSNVEELAEYSSVPVVNGLTDHNHPCQIVGDMMTIVQHRGSLDGQVITFMGDGNNVANSWIEAAVVLPIDVRIATAVGAEPNDGLVRRCAYEGVGSVEIVHDPAAAVEGADVLYTDVWASMGQKDKQDEKAALLADYQLNAERVAGAKPDCIVMHCLPANRGQEITDEVMDGPHSVVFDQAENRLWAQMAIMAKLLA